MSRPWSGARPALAALAGAAVVAAGLVAITTSPAAATTVSDETTFRAAWTNAAETQIDLAANITLTCGGGGVAIRPTTATGAITVNGHGHTITQTCASNGVLRQDGTGALTVQNVTITGGSTNAAIRASANVMLTNASVTGNTGGGINATLGSGGSVTLLNSTVSNNTVTGSGAGIAAVGAVTLTNSTVSGNTATSNGGGIATIVGAGAPVTLTNSTVSGNTATGGVGGGIVAAGAVTVTNSTLSNNTSNADGGAISTQFGGGGAITLVYATVTSNSSPTSSLATSGTSTLTSFGSVVALHIGGANCNISGGTTSNGFNFSDDANATTSCKFNAATDRIGSTNNPMLGALANNGGPTQTRLPQSGSPLIDAIPLASCPDGAAGITIDQRSLARPSGPGCDIGAVEIQIAAPAPVVITPKFTG